MRKAKEKQSDFSLLLPFPNYKTVILKHENFLETVYPPVSLDQGEDEGGKGYNRR